MSQSENIHISYFPSPDTLDYHQILIKNIVALAKHARELSGHNLLVLDIGSGRGELLAALAKERIRAIGLDLDYNCVIRCREIAPVVQGNANDIGAVFKRRSFDLVIASHVLEHMENPTHVIQSIARITRRYLIVAVPNLAEPANVRWRRDEPPLVNRGHKCGWDAPHLKTLLVGCGFRVVAWQADRVYLQRRIRRILAAIGLRKVLEDRLLPYLFPFQSHSLIALAELAEI